MADPGLQIKGQGGGEGEGYAVIQTLRNEKRGGGARPNNFFFRPLGPQFGLKISRGGGLCTVPKE